MRAPRPFITAGEAANRRVRTTLIARLVAYHDSLTDPAGKALIDDVLDALSADLERAA